MAFVIEFSKRFKQFRKKYIGSQYDAAEALEVSQKHISAIETGKVGIGLEIVRILVRKYHMNAQWFMTGIGNHVTNVKDTRKLIHDISDFKADLDAVYALLQHQDRQIKMMAKKLGTMQVQGGDK